MRRLAVVFAVLVTVLALGPTAEGARLLRHGTTTCATTASGTQIVAANENRSAPLYIFNTDASASVYTGSGSPDALTTSNGAELRSRTGRSVPEAGRTIYTGVYRCITSSGTVDLRWEEQLD